VRVRGVGPVPGIVYGTAVHHGKYGTSYGDVVRLPDAGVEPHQRTSQSEQFEDNCEWGPGHQREWLLCSALRTRPSCSFAYAGPLTETVLLANVALRAARGRRLQWDAANLRTDDAAANALLDVHARSGFSI